MPVARCEVRIWARARSAVHSAFSARRTWARTRFRARFRDAGVQTLFTREVVLFRLWMTSWGVLILTLLYIDGLKERFMDLLKKVVCFVYHADYKGFFFWRLEIALGETFVACAGPSNCFTFGPPLKWCPSLRNPIPLFSSRPHHLHQSLALLQGVYAHALYNVKKPSPP
jgi:hypothetical protein